MRPIAVAVDIERHAVVASGPTAHLGSPTTRWLQVDDTLDIEGHQGADGCTPS